MRRRIKGTDTKFGLHEMKKSHPTFEPAGLGYQGQRKTVRNVPRWLKIAGLLLVVWIVAMWFNPSPRVVSLLLIVSGLACVFGGCLLARECWWRWSAASWPEVCGKIAGVRVRRDKSPDQPKHADGSFRQELWEAEVVYLYEVGGRCFRAKEAVCPEKDFTMQFDSREEACAAVSAYRVGAPIRVRHHPTRPGICLLTPRRRWKGTLALSAFLFAMGAIWAAVTWILWTK